MNPSEMERLGFVKYLHDKAIEESQNPQPSVSASVLTMHDAIEMYLYLGAEHLDLSKSTRISFLEYWELFDGELDNGGGLTHKSAMERLNRARRNLKHAGNRPHHDDIISYRVAMTEFFEENTPDVFGIPFDEISLVDLIEHEEVRKLLSEAEEALNDGDADLSIEKSALAFDSLLRDSLQQMQSIPGGKLATYNSGISSTFKTSSVSQNFPHDVDRNLASSISDLGSSINDLVRDLEREFDDIENSFDQVNETLRVLALGIDLPRHSRFREITPAVMHIMGGERDLAGSENGYGDLDDAEFCLNFVVDNALEIQESEISPSSVDD